MAPENHLELLQFGAGGPSPGYSPLGGEAQLTAPTVLTCFKMIIWPFALGLTHLLHAQCVWRHKGSCKSGNITSSESLCPELQNPLSGLFPDAARA